MKKYLVVTAVILFYQGVYAQFNFNEMGKKTIYFGIALGVNIADFKIIPSALQHQNDSVKYIRTAIGPGFNLGIIGNYQFHKYFDLRFIPTLSFSDKLINYQVVNTNTLASKDLSSIYLDFPLQVRFKSEPIKDFRVYVIAGG